MTSSIFNNPENQLNCIKNIGIFIYCSNTNFKSAALIALSTVAIQMTFLSEASINAKKYVARSLCIGWIAITNGKTWFTIEENKFAAGSLDLPSLYKFTQVNPSAYY